MHTLVASPLHRPLGHMGMPGHGRVDRCMSVALQGRFRTKLFTETYLTARNVKLCDCEDFFCVLERIGTAIVFVCVTRTWETGVTRRPKSWF